MKPSTAAPLAVRLNCCDVCQATNPTRPDEPVPTRCSSCGSPIRQAPSWEGKGRAYGGAAPDFYRHAPRC